MRQAKINYQDQIAGILSEADDGEYTFLCESASVEEYTDQFITFTMPVREEI